MPGIPGDVGSCLLNIIFLLLLKLGQSIRLLLNYVGQEFEDLRFEQGDAPDFSREEWYSRKFSYGLDFPNLPFYIDGDIKMTQSNAILRYLGRKHDMVGKTEVERVMVDVLLNHTYDIFFEIFDITYSPEYEQKKTTLFDKMKDYHLPLLEKYFEKGSVWSVGDDMTVADFLLYEVLDELRVLKTDIMDKFPKLNDFLDRFEALPAIKKYMESDKFLKRPLFSKYAGYSIANPEH